VIMRDATTPFPRLRFSCLAELRSARPHMKTCSSRDVWRALGVASLELTRRRAHKLPNRLLNEPRLENPTACRPQ